MPVNYENKEGSPRKQQHAAAVSVAVSLHVVREEMGPGQAQTFMRFGGRRAHSQVASHSLHSCPSAVKVKNGAPPSIELL